MGRTGAVFGNRLLIRTCHDWPSDGSRVTGSPVSRDRWQGLVIEPVPGPRSSDQLRAVQRGRGPWDGSCCPERRRRYQAACDGRRPARCDRRWVEGCHRLTGGCGPSRCLPPWRRSGAPAVSPRVSRPARTPAPAASSRKVPGLLRANRLDLAEKVDRAPCSPARTAMEEVRSGRLTDQVAGHALLVRGARPCCAAGWRYCGCLRRPSAAGCRPGLSGPDFAWCIRSCALDLASDATWAASSLAVCATFWAADAAAVRATSVASSFAASLRGGAGHIAQGGGARNVLRGRPESAGAGGGCCGGWRIRPLVLCHRCSLFPTGRFGWPKPARSGRR